MRPRIVFYCGERVFFIDDEVQAPDRYSVFFAEHLQVNKGEVALDLCTGCGFFAVFLASTAAKVVAVDIQEKAVQCARKNAICNDMEKVIDVRQGDLFCSLKGDERFDLIVSLPPVMPSCGRIERTDWFGIANEGGSDGRRIIDRIIRESTRYLRPGGRLQLMQPWYIDIEKSKKALEAVGFKVVNDVIGEFCAGVLSFERMAVFDQLGFPLLNRGGKLIQIHHVITALLE